MTTNRHEASEAVHVVGVRERPTAPVRSHEVTASIRAKARSAYRKDRRARWLLPTVLILALLLLWELYGRFVGFNPLFFAYPSQIWHGLVTYAQNNLWTDVGTSATEWAIGMAVALVAIPAGMVIGRNRMLLYALDPVIDALYATPHLALMPLFIIWFGLGLTAKVVMVATGALFPLLISVIVGARTVDGVLLKAASSLGATRRHLYFDVIVPATVPFILSGLRLAIRGGVLGVVLGEFLGGLNGVGYRIRALAEQFQTAEYLAGVILLVGASVVLNFAIRILERRVAPWREGSESV